MTIDQIYSQFTKKYRKALVTGGAGFIGSHIVENLVIRGFPVISIDNYSAGKKINLRNLKKYSNFTEVKCDILDVKNLPKYFKGVDVVFHNAASKKNVCLKDPRKDLLVNAVGTFNLLELARTYKVKKFIHASTGSVYGERISKQNEGHPLNPVSYYGVSKLAGEKYVKLFYELHNLDTTVLRYFHVYGSRQEFNEYGGVVAIFINQILANKTPIIYGTGKQQRSFTHVDDVVKANMLVAIKKESKGEVYNCASGMKITINRLYKEIARILKVDTQPIYKDWLVGDIKSFDIDNKKIRELGMEFRLDFNNCIDETIKDMKVYIENAKKGSPKAKKNIRRV